MATAEIYAANGKAVNLRKGPSTSTASLKQLPVGTKVEVIGETDDWVQVKVGGLTGWVTGWIMREYVRGGTVSGAEGGVPSDIEERLARLEERVTALEGGHG